MKVKAVYILIINLALLTACSVYQPQLTDIPLINHKNDLRISGGISANIAAYTSISYGMTDNLSIQATGSIGSDDKYYFQGAFGHFKPLNTNIHLELYGGIGFGYGSVYRDATPGDLFGPYQLYFSQLNLGRIHHHFANLDYGFGVKAGLFNSYFTDRNYYAYYSEEGPFNTSHDYSFLFEPTFFTRFGGEQLKFSVQMGFCLIDQFSSYENRLPYSIFNLGISLSYTP